jgi:hypothetical protein
MSPCVLRWSVKDFRLQWLGLYYPSTPQSKSSTDQPWIVWSNRSVIVYTNMFLCACTVVFEAKKNILGEVIDANVLLQSRDPWC